MPPKKQHGGRFSHPFLYFSGDPVGWGRVLHFNQGHDLPNQSLRSFQVNLSWLVTPVVELLPLHIFFKAAKGLTLCLFTKTGWWFHIFLKQIHPEPWGNDPI